MKRHQAEAFRSLVGGFAAKGDEDSEMADQGRCAVAVDGQKVQILLSPERDEVIFSTVVFRNDGKAGYLVPEIISDFNAVHLFEGGYCLLVEEATQSIYVNRPRRLRALTPSKVGAELHDLVARAQTWATWYVIASKEFWQT